MRSENPPRRPGRPASRSLIAALAAAVVLAATSPSALAQPGGDKATAAAKDIRLELLARLDSGSGEAGAEVAVFDKLNALVLVTNGAENRIDIFPLAGGAPAGFDLSPYGAGVQSVAVSNGLAVAVVSADPVVEPGSAVFFDPAAPGAGPLAVLEVGALPDMVTFTHQGDRVLVANEGEPRCIDATGRGTTDPASATNPEGSVTVIEIVGGMPAGARTVGFAAYDGREAELRAGGVRVGTWPGATVSQDLEPEYVAVSRDGKRAYVTLQENNAVAVIDPRSGALLDVVGLGLKDHTAPGDGLDASNRDDAANIRDWPVAGMYMPDAIAAWKSGGRTWIATANEGDGREYFANATNDEDGAGICFLDESRVKDLALAPGFPVPAGIAGDLQDDANLGRLKVSKVFPSTFTGGPPPLDDTDPEDVPGLAYTSLASYGARSVSIWDEDGNLVWDSGEAIARAVLAAIGEDAWVNGPVPGTTSPPDERSDDKGAEPEGVAAGRAYGRDLLFVGLERAGGIVVFDATDPAAPTLLEWKQTEDISPEALQFVPEEDSPTGRALLVVSYEISGTTAVFELVR